VIAESALLSNIPAIIFDWTNAFNRIGEASKNIEELEKYQVKMDPIGFPVRRSAPADGIVIDINLLSTDGIAEIFGIGEKNFSRILKMVLSSGNFSSINELAEKISSVKQTDEFSEYEILKAARIMKLIEVIYPGFFKGGNEISEMASSSGNSKIARTSVFDLSSLDKRAAILFSYSIIRGLLEHHKKTGLSNSVKSLLVIPEAGKIMPNDNEMILSKEIISLLKQGKAYGLAFALSTNQIIDLSGEIRKECEAQINIVSENDVGVQLKNRKAYRVLVRPTLSKDGASEKETAKLFKF
jgi:hypothetical protein